MVNIITGRNSDNAPYVTLVADTAAGAISLGEFTNIYANGGDDGDLSLALFEAKVAEAMVKYADEDDAVQNSARFRETTWTDTGFNLDTKIAAISMLAVRHDTGIILGTYEVDASIKAAGPPANWVLGQLQTQEEELAIFTYIRNRLNTVPDSVKYGTSALRAIVIKGSGKLRNTTFQQRVPLTHWIHNKASQLMGSKDGRWKTTDLFDMAPGHIIDNMFDLSEDWVPLSAKQRFWDMGLNYHLTYNDTESMVPILKSVYQSETSIFNNWLTTVATQIIDQSVNRVWRDYVGTISLTGPQLTKAINDAIALDLTGLFGSLYVIKPRAQITDLDLARGYSVDVPVDMYANTMMTVFTTHVRGLRMSELTGN